MAVSDRLVGGFLIFTSLVIFLYYTTWIFAIPFLAPSNPLLNWFPPAEYAITLPALILVFGILLIGGFISFVFIKESQKKKSQ